ncbi:MAG: WD40/YVTN/BNR-like repeat-containing protein [Acidimicrobiales bacterium]
MRSRWLSVLATIGVLPIASCGSVSTHVAKPVPHVKATSSTTPPTIPTTTAASSTQFYPLFLGHGIGVAGTQQSNGCSYVYLTRDFIHWQAVTPPVSPQVRQRLGPCPYAWGDPSFVSRSDGWILGRVNGNVTTVLYHTLNGGRSWVQQPGGSTGANGGWELIGFANTLDGWRQQFAMGSNRGYTLELTTNGGTTWGRVPSPDLVGGCQLASDVFANAHDGFAGGFLRALWHTTDGGESWRQMTIAAPASLAHALAMYGTPTFFGGSTGVLPVAFIKGSSSFIAFYLTTNTGATWSLQNVEPAMGTARTPATTGPVCNVAPPTGVPPTVGVAGPSTWWVVNNTQPPTVSTTNDSGRTWETVTATGLPVTKSFTSTPGFNFQAASATMAWISAIPPGHSHPTLFQSIDGGRKWSRISPP